MCFHYTKATNEQEIFSSKGKMDANDVHLVNAAKITSIFQFSLHAVHLDFLLAAGDSPSPDCSYRQPIWELSV